MYLRNNKEIDTRASVKKSCSNPELKPESETDLHKKYGISKKDKYSRLEKRVRSSIMLAAKRAHDTWTRRGYPRKFARELCFRSILSHAFKPVLYINNSKNKIVGGIFKNPKSGELFGISLGKVSYLFSDSKPTLTRISLQIIMDDIKIYEINDLESLEILVHVRESEYDPLLFTEETLLVYRPEKVSPYGDIYYD